MTITVSRPGAPRPVTPQTILASRLDQLARQLEAAEGVDPALKAGLRAVCELASGLDPYLSRWTTPESPALRQLAQRTQAEDWRQHPGDGAAAPPA
jgi:caffeoyl-CoA O-methyltransferase